MKRVKEFLRLFLTKEFQAGDGYMFSNPTNEEAEEYFNGQRGLDETADLIQNRVTTYVNEKR